MATKSEIKEKIESRESKKEGYESIKQTLEEQLGILITEQNKLLENIKNPIAKYKLAGESSDDWKGANYDTAKYKKCDIESALSGYDGDIGTLKGEISQAIEELETAISDLKSEIADLWEEYDAAPEDDESNDTDDGEG